MESGKNMDLEINLSCTIKGLNLKILGLRPTDKVADQLLGYQTDLRADEGLISINRR